MVRHYLCQLRAHKRSDSAKRRLTETSPLGPLLLGFLRYFGPRFNYHSLACCVDGTTRSKADCGLVDNVFVLLNPLEEKFVNCANSAFRMAEIATMFAVVEQQLHDAIDADLTAKDAKFQTVLSCVCFADPLIEQRRKIFRELRSSQRVTPSVERSERGKAPRKALKIDLENSPVNTNTL
jgi:DNA polymerase sigma